MTADRLGIADRFRVLDRDGVREVIDSPVFEGGVVSTDGATVQPARLARGLRRVLLETGVRIPEQTVVEVVDRVREASARRHLVYLRDGIEDTIRVIAAKMADAAIEGQQRRQARHEGTSDEAV